LFYLILGRLDYLLATLTLQQPPSGNAIVLDHHLPRFCFFWLKTLHFSFLSSNGKQEQEGEKCIFIHYFSCLLPKKLLSHQVFFIFQRNPTMSSTWHIFRNIFTIFMLCVFVVMVLELIYSIIRLFYKIFVKWWRSPSPAAVAPQPVNEVQMLPV
jgi:hypothetical protein